MQKEQKFLNRLYINHHQKIKVMVVVLEVVALLVVLIAPLAPARKAVK